MKKSFVMDTNVLLYDPNSLFAFEDNEVIIPLIVLDELDKHKDGNSQTSKHARMAIRYLDKMRAIGNLHDGVKTDRGGLVRVELNHRDQVPKDLDPDRADNRIISVALGVSSAGQNVRVITKDINLRVKCDALGVDAEDFFSDVVAKNVDCIYNGLVEVEASGRDLDELYKNSILEIEDAGIHPNQYVLLKCPGSDRSALTRYIDGKLQPIGSYNEVWGISPRNKEQACAFDALFDPDIKLVTIMGRAGTGKTLLSAAAGISQLLDSHKYKRIVLTRPIQPVGRDLGFLPGTLSEKMAPWMAPLHDNLDLIFSNRGRSYIEGLFADGSIEVAPLTYIRGRSMPNSYIIVDETQNITRHEIKTLLTRVGEGSKVVLTGDVEQIDSQLLDSVSNGLSCVVELFKTDPIAAHIKMIKGERSELATKTAAKL